MGANLSAERNPVKVPLAWDEELTAGRIKDRRPELAEHVPSGEPGVTLAARVIHAMKTKANGHTPDLRLDRQKRYRGFQFDGSKALPIEDVTAIAFESDLGREVVLDGLRVLAEALGYGLTPLQVTTADVLDAGTDLMDEAVAAGAALLRDAKDGTIDEPEAHRARIAKVEGTLAEIKASITPRVLAHRTREGR
jgi:hypothetical protein